jgi:hypothetical protein
MVEKTHIDDDEEFLRRMIFPEEDRHRFTATPWRGGYRWFKSPNVISIERYKRAIETKTNTNPPSRVA